MIAKPVAIGAILGKCLSTVVVCQGPDGLGLPSARTKRMFES